MQREAPLRTTSGQSGEGSEPLNRGEGAVRRSCRLFDVTLRSMGLAVINGSLAPILLP